MAYFPHYWELALGWSPDQYIRFSSILGTLSCFPSYDMKSIATLLVLFPTSEHVVSFEAYLAGLKLDYTSGEITWEWEEEKEEGKKEKHKRTLHYVSSTTLREILFDKMLMLEINARLSELFEEAEYARMRAIVAGTEHITEDRVIFYTFLEARDFVIMFLDAHDIDYIYLETKMVIPDRIEYTVEGLKALGESEVDIVVYSAERRLRKILGLEY